MKSLIALCVVVAAWMLPIGEAHNTHDMYLRMVPSYILILLMLYMSALGWTGWWAIKIAIIEAVLLFFNYQIIENWPQHIWSFENYDGIQRVGFTLELIILTRVLINGLDYGRFYGSIQHIINRVRNI